MKLYLSVDLLKSSIPPTRVGTGVPKTPGAATTGSGPQIVDCPLGAACPDGGKHQMGSKTLSEHVKAAQTHAQTGVKPGDETKGQDTGKIGVPPGASNIGSVGSDQVKRTPPPTDTTMEVDSSELRPETQTMQVNTGDIKSPNAQFSAKEYERDPHNAKTRAYLQGHVEDEPPSPPPLPRKPSSGNQVAGQNMDRPGMGTAQVPNPLVANEQVVPPDSKPMDHYKLSKIARESGDDELASFHENMARKRTEGMGSEDHKKLADELHAAGMHQQAEYHRGIHQRVSELGGDNIKADPEAEKKHQDSMRDVHHEQRNKANADLEEAKKKHAETKAKAEKIKKENEVKQKEYEDALAEHSKKKEEAKASPDKKNVKRVGKPPEKPALAKIEKVPEQPDLYEPENDADKLRHETHTSKAKRLADIAESHLKDNTNLSASDREKLSRVHKMAVYHSNIGYTPTAAHKKELADIESAMSDMNVKKPHAEIKAAEDAKNTAIAAKQAAKDKSEADKKSKLDAKEQAKQSKEESKQAKTQPTPPQTNLDHARVADHKAQAEKLRNNIQSHVASNPNMSDADKAKAEKILKELEKHEQLDMVPGSAHQAELKELQKLSGEHGKQQYEPDQETDVSPRSTFGNAGGYVLPMVHSGRALGTGLAASATSPYGAAGHLGPQMVSYGVTGATTAGHRLLHDAGQAAKDEKDIQAGLDAEKEAQEKRAKQASAIKPNQVVGRGNQ